MICSLKPGADFLVDNLFQVGAGEGRDRDVGDHLAVEAGCANEWRHLLNDLVVSVQRKKRELSEANVDSNWTPNLS